MRERQAHARRHRVAAKTADQARTARIDLGQRIAQMKSRDRTARSAKIRTALIGRRERDDRPMQPLLELGRDQPDDAGVPVRLIEHDALRKRVVAVRVEECGDGRLALRRPSHPASRAAAR